MTDKFDYFVLFAEMRTGSNYLEVNIKPVKSNLRFFLLDTEISALFIFFIKFLLFPTEYFVLRFV